MSHKITSATLADFASISKGHPGSVTVVGAACAARSTGHDGRATKRERHAPEGEGTTVTQKPAFRDAWKREQHECPESDGWPSKCRPSRWAISGNSAI